MKQLAARREDVAVVEELARLVNSLSSDRLGRNYLLQPAGKQADGVMWLQRCMCCCTCKGNVRV